MAFNHKGLWTARDGDYLTKGEMAYGNSSRVESKRGHQWFMDNNRAELLSNKKQVIEADNSGPMAGIPRMDVSPWDNNSSYQPVPGQYTGNMFESESITAVNPVDRNNSSVANEIMNMRRKGFEYQLLKTPVSLCINHTVEDPSSRLRLGGIRTVKVNEVRDRRGNGIPVFMGHSYDMGDSSTIAAGTNSKNNGNIVSHGATSSNGGENTISTAPTFSKGDNSFSSVSHSCYKEGSFIVMGDNYNEGDHSIVSTGQTLDKRDGNFVSVGHLYGKGTNNVMSMGPPYSKARENFMPVDPTWGKANDNFVSMRSCYSRENDNIISTGQTNGEVDPGIVTIGSTSDKGDYNIMSMDRGENNINRSGDIHDQPDTNPSGRIISSYDLMMHTQNAAPNSESPGQRDMVEPSMDVAPKSNSETQTALKNKEPKMPKKLPPNNFPANVKSLLSTGMLDGVRVKYVSWSREKHLHGVIKGASYMCGCQECQFSKALNAYEFERHAGCKTKHPNNHIYFENGKTIYAVVQELKNTPQESLFDAIQNVTGSSINVKNFRIWKASYKAASLELQRIYGKEAVAVP